MNASKFATRMNASKLGVLAVLTLVLATSLSAAPVAAADGEIRALNPSHLEHGDSAQTISIVGTAPGELTVLTIDVTPLAAAGVDLSNATLSVDRDPNDLLSNARIERTDDAVLLRVRIAARANDTDFRARLRLDNIDTSDADHTDLRYDADFGDQSLHSHWFELSDPRIPELSEVSEPEWLVAGQENASQETRLIMFSLPSNTSLTVTVDLSNLTEAGVALTDVEATATISDQGATVKSVQRSGSTVEIGVDVTTAERVGIELDLRGLDTTAVEERTTLSYGITVEAPAGTATGRTEQFSVYPPGDTPTATPTPMETDTVAITTRGSTDTASEPGPTITEPDREDTDTPSPDDQSPTDGASTTTGPVSSPTVGSGAAADGAGDTGSAGAGPGFTVLAATLAVLGVAGLLTRRD